MDGLTREARTLADLVRAGARGPHCGQVSPRIERPTVAYSPNCLVDTETTKHTVRPTRCASREQYVFFERLDYERHE